DRSRHTGRGMVPGTDDQMGVAARRRRRVAGVAPVEFDRSPLGGVVSAGDTQHGYVERLELDVGGDQAFPVVVNTRAVESFPGRIAVLITEPDGRVDSAERFSLFKALDKETVPQVVVEKYVVLARATGDAHTHPDRIGKKNITATRVVPAWIGRGH